MSLRSFLIKQSHPISAETHRLRRHNVSINIFLRVEPPSPMSAVFQNEDLLWIVVSYSTGFESFRASNTKQRHSTSTSAAPILPLLMTFQSLRRARMEEMGIPLVSLKSQFVTSVPMVEWAVSRGLY
mmetsp:Transcript_34858/g.65008  ORF Transcript_34858/g.65008 Transcript_34858/m.65008 type:complete len:127 (+) Transcript_34858:272-652(+)